MVEFLLILHLFGLGMGFAALLGGYVVSLAVNASPPVDAPVLARVLPGMGRMGEIGLAILLVTGPLLLWLKRNGTPPDWPLFALKIAAVAAFTAMVILLGVTAKKVQRDRDMVAAGRLPLYRRLAITLLMLVVVFAVLAFD